MEYKDYYDILGLKRSATQDEIRRAYRKLVRKYHPDVNKDADADVRFKEVGEANEVLGDPEKRAAYDQLGKNWQAGEQFREPPDWEPGFAFSGGGFTDADQSSFSDFFETLFGQAEHARRAQQRAGPFQGAGTDQYARITIDIPDVFTGATRTLTLRMQEVDRAGRVRMKDHDLAVRIPKGAHEGQHIRLKGQGHPAFDNGPAGDLFLEVAFNPHPMFSVAGLDVHLNLPVTPWEAALGSKVKMPTPGGPVDITIPKNARSGQKLRLKGRGIPGKAPGNLIAHLQIINPPVNSEKGRQFYEQMAQEMDFDPRAGMKV